MFIKTKKGECRLVGSTAEILNKSKNDLGVVIDKETLELVYGVPWAKVREFVNWYRSHHHFHPVDIAHELLVAQALKLFFIQTSENEWDRWRTTNGKN